MFKTVEQILDDPEMCAQREILCDRLEHLINEIMDAVCTNGRGITGGETRLLCDLSYQIDAIKCKIAKSILDSQE